MVRSGIVTGISCIALHMASLREPAADAALAVATRLQEEGDAALAKGDFSRAIDRYNDAASVEGIPPQFIGGNQLKLCVAYRHRSQSASSEKGTTAADVRWAVTCGSVAVRMAPSAGAYLEHSRALCALANRFVEPDVALRTAEEAVAEIDRGLGLAPGDVELTSLRAEATRIVSVHKRRPAATCDVCSEPSAHRCGRCGRSSYCSSGCQRKHWPEHKKTCTPPSRPVDVSSPLRATGAPASPATAVPFAAAQTHGYYPASPVRSRLVTDASVAEFKANLAANIPELPHSAALIAEAKGLKVSPILSIHKPGPLLSLIMTDMFVGVSTAIGLGVSPDLQVRMPCPIHYRDELTSILSLSVHFGDAEAVKALLAAGARVDWGRPDESRTPLVDAADYRRPEIAAALLDAGADVRAANEVGMTALHVLLKASSLKATPGSGGMAMGVPKTCSQAEWVSRGDATLTALCAAPGIPVNALDSKGWTPLLLAADSGNEHAVRTLIAAGAEVNNPGGLSMRPLEIAMRRGHAKAAAALRGAGAM